MAMHWPWNRNKDLNEELEAHFRMAVQDRIAAGASEREALASARREFGNVGLIKEVTRDMWAWRFVGILLKDTTYALRNFRKNPGFAVTAIVTLALGIGGNTAIFSLIDAVMLRSLPVANPSGLYRIGTGYDSGEETGLQNQWGMYSFAFYKRLKTAAPEFEQLAASQSHLRQFGVRRIGNGHIAYPLREEFVTRNYFSTFGIQPFAGRLFSPDDERASAPPVAVLSYRTWRGRYGGDPSIVGATFAVNTPPFTIIGIAPPGFFGETWRSDPPEIWLPLHQEPLIDGKASLLDQRDDAWLRVIGRLHPGATIAGLSARLTGALREWLKSDSGYPVSLMPGVIRLLPQQTINVVPAGSGVQEMKDEYGRSLDILLAVCGLVLLIACANIANLLLARGMARRGDTALRLAMGASSGRLVSQALTESILLAIGGGIAGLAVAYGADRLLLALAFRSAHFVPIGASPSLLVLAFALGLSLATGIVFGTSPAWFATHMNPMDALRGAHHSIGSRTSFSRNALLAVQAALSVVLVAGAAMLTRSLGNLEHQNFGFPTANRISVRLNIPQTYSPARLDVLYGSLEDRLHSLPGIKRAGLALYNPFTGNWFHSIYLAGSSSPNKRYEASWNRVSAGYFHTLGEPVRRGRGFTRHDTSSTPAVAVVNQAFAKKFFPNENPIGQHFGLRMPANANTFRIVGVVRDAKYMEPAAPARPMFFLPLMQSVRYGDESQQKDELGTHFISSLLLNTQLPPNTLEPVLKKTFADIDPNLTIINVRTMQQQVAMNFDQERAVASLAGLFGIVALILAAVGLYGVLAYSVTQRTSEIGVRMALGADRAGIVGLVLRGAFIRAALGLMLGIPLAIGAGRLISSQLYGVSAWDPLALAIATGSLAICAFVAAVIPARRAASIEPMEALRVE